MLAPQEGKSRGFVFELTAGARTDNEAPWKGRAIFLPHLKALASRTKAQSPGTAIEIGKIVYGKRLGGSLGSGHLEAQIKRVLERHTPALFHQGRSQTLKGGAGGAHRPQGGHGNSHLRQSCVPPYLKDRQHTAIRLKKPSLKEHPEDLLATKADNLFCFRKVFQTGGDSWSTGLSSAG
jgi:hypothetical protein